MAILTQIYESIHTVNIWQLFAWGSAVKRIVISAGACLLLVAVAVFLLGDRLLMTVVQKQVERNLSGQVLNTLPDGLHLLLCGSGAPLADPERAGPCIMVLAGNDLYVVDIGSGAARNFGLMGIPPGRIEGLFLTHFHSDHFDGLGELMTVRWAGGARTEPLPVYGPSGVEQVVQGYNLAYRQDVEHRIAHHGEAVVPRSGAGGLAKPFTRPGEAEAVEVLNHHGLTVTAFAVPHEPVQEAVGYRFDYKGRSLVISGDTSASENLQLFSEDVDLLAHEALAPEIVEILGRAAANVGMPNIHRITEDILSYHTTPVQAAEIAEQAGVRHLLFYHLIPPLPVKPLEWLFVRGVSDAYSGKYTLGRDGTLISLPEGSDEISVRELL